MEQDSPIPIHSDTTVVASGNIHRHRRRDSSDVDTKSVSSTRTSSTQVADEATPLLGESQEVGEDDESNDWADLPWHRRPSVFLLLPPLCLFTMTFGGVAVPRLNVILSLICRQYFADRQIRFGSDESASFPVLIGMQDKQCQIPEIQSLVSKFTLYLSLTSGILGAFTSPRLGSLSDRYGRRALMAISFFGLLSNAIATILAVKYPDIFSINIMYIGVVVDGLCGSFMLSMALSYSYGADCTSPKQRAVAFGYFQGCLFLGLAIGPVLGGLLIKATGNPLSVFYAALGAYVFLMAYLLLFLPESLSERRMKLARVKHEQERGLWAGGMLGSWLDSLNPINLIRPLSILCPTGPGTSSSLRLNLMLLAATDCILFGVGVGGMTVIIIYAELIFGWGDLESSVYLSVVNSVRVAMLFAIVPSLVAVFRGGPQSKDMHRGTNKLDLVLIRFSIIVEAIGYIGYAVASSGAAFTVAGTFTALGGIGSPTLHSSLTKHMPSDKTGQLLGATALLHSLAQVTSPAIFNLIYAYTVGTFPQAVFVCLGSTFVFALVSSSFIKTHVFLDEGVIEGERPDGDAVGCSSN